LIIVIPELDPGSYQLEIVTQFTTGAPLKTPCIIVFDRILTVP
jgi:hypothetical protein